MNIQEREQELRRRLAYPYQWGGVQNNRRDRATDFVYETPRFEDFLGRVRHRFEGNPQYDAWFNYALNRWYNYWSAKAVEEIFCALERVTPAKDDKDRLVDFKIGRTRFDHKTSIFPVGFGHSLGYARNHPTELIEWLYNNQSQERRRHLKNRLFIILYAHDGQHWRLKAEITWLRTLIQAYVRDFQLSRVYRFSFDSKATTLADIIWAVKQ
jgi:hypothetical protein